MGAEGATGRLIEGGLPNYRNPNLSTTCVTRGLTFETKGEIINFSRADRSFARKT
jgi:hypothetical protein